MKNTITPEDFTAAVEMLTGVPAGFLREVHVANGVVTYVTAQNPLTGLADAGFVQVHTTPEPKPQPEPDPVDDDDLEFYELDEEEPFDKDEF